MVVSALCFSLRLACPKWWQTCEISGRSQLTLFLQLGTLEGREDCFPKSSSQSLS